MYLPHTLTRKAGLSRGSQLPKLKNQLKKSLMATLLLMIFFVMNNPIRSKYSYYLLAKIVFTIFFHNNKNEVIINRY